MSAVDPIMRVLKERRERCGLTFRDVREALGFHPAVIIGWERGTWEPKLRQVRAYARLVGATIEITCETRTHGPYTRAVGSASSHTFDLGGEA